MGQILGADRGFEATPTVQQRINSSTNSNDNLSSGNENEDAVCKQQSVVDWRNVEEEDSNELSNNPRQTNDDDISPTITIDGNNNNNTNNNNNIHTGHGTQDSTNRNSTITVASKYCTPGTSFDDITAQMHLCDGTTQTEVIPLQSSDVTTPLEAISCDDKGVQTEGGAETHQNIDSSLVSLSVDDNDDGKHDLTLDDEKNEIEIVGVGNTEVENVSVVNVEEGEPEVMTVDCSVQTESVGGEGCCDNCSSSSTSPRRSPQPLHDYLHCDNNMITTPHNDEQPRDDDGELLKPHENEELKSSTIDSNTDQQENNATVDNDKDNDDVGDVDVERWKILYEETLKQNEILTRHEADQKTKFEMKLLQSVEENTRMKEVVEQYEQLMLEMTERSGDRHQVDATLSATIAAKEQVEGDLHKAENNLVQAFKRIEKLKEAVDAYRTNEGTISASLKDHQNKLEKSEEKYKRLREECSAKMDCANIEMAKLRQQKQIDLAGIEAALKRAEHRNLSLEKDIERKTDECRELSLICDELIKKVSVE